jgi:hypothetical protein
LFGRSGDWQGDADGERGGSEQSGRHRVAELRAGVVSTASFSVVLSGRGRPERGRCCGRVPQTPIWSVRDRAERSRASPVSAVISKIHC